MPININAALLCDVDCMVYYYDITMHSKGLLMTGLSYLPLPPKVDGGYLFTPVCLSVCLSVSTISQKVMHGFGRNLVDRLGV